jgi:acyl carrier protein
MEEQVRKVMSAVFGIDVTDINDDAAPGTIEQWDSLRQMNLVIALEEEFGVRFSEEQTEQMVSFKLICLIVRELAGMA